MCVCVYVCVCVCVCTRHHRSSSIGLSLAIAIALHNIPEGVAVALPVYFATGSRLRGFMYAFVSGLAEPLAVIVLGVVFRAFWLDKMVIDCLLAAVSGDTHTHTHRSAHIHTRAHVRTHTNTHMGWC